MNYDSSLNVDPGNTGEPLVAQPGSSVVKAISMEDDSGRPIISDAVVLTILDEDPPENSFRPPYTGTDKTIVATEADLDYNRLGNYTKLGNEPDLNSITQRYERVWLEHCTSWVARDIHPQNNMPAYGRDIARSSAEGLILLQLDYTVMQKQPLLVGLVQYGIDIYGIAKQDGAWKNNGGHNLGRKMPLLLAARVLNNDDMLVYADKQQHFIFQDDQQHFYVSQAEVDRTHCVGCTSCSTCWNPDDRAPATPYEVDDIGTAEWGIRHYDKPQADNANWAATYRHVNGYSQVMQIFAAQLMGVQEEWNWPPVFDYADRFYAAEQGGFPEYFVGLWSAYRGNLVSRYKADLSGDGAVNLIDVIIALKVLTEQDINGLRSDYITSGVDVDGNGKLQFPEVFYLLGRLVDD
jgi:ferredoxin